MICPVMIWWAFRCDKNHPWEFRADDAADVPPGVEMCPVDGTPAVTALQMTQADRVRISIVPAARVADEVTGSVTHDDRFLLEISSWQGEKRISSAELGWADAVERAGWFRSLSWSEAENRWKRTGLGDSPATEA